MAQKGAKNKWGGKKAKAQQVKIATGGVPIATLEWAARSHALSAQVSFEFLNFKSEGQPRDASLGALRATCALGAQVLHSWGVFETSCFSFLLRLHSLYSLLSLHSLIIHIFLVIFHTFPTEKGKIEV